jgi:hypothetical protein
MSLKAKINPEPFDSDGLIFGTEGGRDARVRTLPVPLMLPVVGKVPDRVSWAWAARFHGPQ